MIFIHLNSKDGNIEEFNKYLEEGKQIFVLIYMDGCGPCNVTRPEWKKIENILKKKYSYLSNIVVADIDQELISKIPLLKKQPSGFPTMYFISNKGNNVEDYEESSIYVKDRSIDSFIEWIESKIKYQGKGGRKSKTKIIKKRKNTLKKRKWSLKYKKSINCSRPKGFSQKQYCKYNRNKNKNMNK